MTLEQMFYYSLTFHGFQFLLIISLFARMDKHTKMHKLALEANKNVLTAIKILAHRSGIDVKDSG